MASFFRWLHRALLRLLNPPWYQPPFFVVESLHLTRAYYVAAELGIADLLNERPRDLAELAAATASDPRSLYRMLRTLAAFGIFSEDRRGQFHMTRRARVLLSDHPQSLRSWLRFMGRTELWQGFARTLDAVKTGIPPFELAHGTGFYEYLGTHPELAEIFVHALGDWADWQARAIVKAYDFGSFRSVIDVGGGTGTLLREILAAHPKVQGVLFDQPATIRMAGPHFQATDLKDRSKLVGGCFREGIPAGADAFVLKHVIYDWNDEGASHILRNCHRAMGPDAKLLVVEGVVDPRSGMDRVVKIMDLEMGSLLRGGPRTEAELKALLERSGFRLVKIHPTTVLDIRIVEAQKATVNSTVEPAVALAGC